MIMCAIVCRNLYLGIFEFPIKGISLILGNDLAGSMVSILSSKPQTLYNSTGHAWVSALYLQLPWLVD